MLARRFTQMIALTRPVMAAPIRTFSNDSFANKSKGDEKAYFSKKDSEMLKALVEKMNKRDELGSEKVEQHSAVCEDLDALFESHDMDKSGKHALLYADLVAWKRHDY